MTEEKPDDAPDGFKTDSLQPRGSNGDTDDAATGVRVTVIFARIVQALLVFLAVVTVAGAMSMNMITGIALLVLALVLLAFAGVVEAVVRLVRGRWG